MCQLEHAKQSVQHLQLDPKSAAAELLTTVTSFVDGGIKLASAVAAKNVDDLWEALKSLKEAVSKAREGKEDWYGVVRLLEDLPPDQLCEFVDPGLTTASTRSGGSDSGSAERSESSGKSRLAEEEYDETVTFFVVELLDAIARTRDVSDIVTSETLVRGDATTDTMLRVGDEPLPRARAIKLLAMLFKGECPHLPVDSRELQARILLALKRLCSLPSNPALVVVAKTTVKELFQHSDAVSCWGEWCSCVAAAVSEPIAPTLTVSAGSHSEPILSSAERVDFLTPEVRPSHRPGDGVSRGFAARPFPSPPCE